MTKPEFNLKLGEALKTAGMEAAADARATALMLGRHYCRVAAEKRPSRLATADDAARGFMAAGLSPDLLGNAAGSLFTKADWVFAERWVKSVRKTNRARYIRVWRLRNGSAT